MSPAAGTTRPFASHHPPPLTLVNTPPFLRLLVLAAILPLAGCARSAAPRPVTAAATSASLPPAVNAAVTISEADTGHTVHLGPSQTIAIRLAVNETTGNRWFLSNPLLGGVLVKKGNTTYTDTPSGTVATLLYQGLRAGTQELHFTYAPPEARQNVAREADFRVIVR